MLAKNQQGMARISFVLVIVVGIFFAICAIRLVPLYYENFTIKASLRDLKTERAIAGGASDAVRYNIQTFLQKRFRVNNVDRTRLDNLSIRSTSDGYEVSLPYEVRVKIIGNIDAVVSFDNHVTVRTR